MLRNRDYLSWSQYSLWQKSKREFWKKYGLNEDRSMNKNFTKGKEFGSAMEYDDDGESSSDELLKVVLQMVPKLDFQEYKINVPLENGENILSIMDSSAADDSEFYEYKTGKDAWTQELVEKHEQLLFYALAFYIKTGRGLVPKCKLFWIETEQTETGGLKYTGVIEEFKRTFTVDEIEAFEQKLIATIAEIEEWEYLELEVDDVQMNRYIHLQELIKTAQAEADLIKLDIQVRMEAEGFQYANATNGKFSISKRKSWEYSEDLVKVKESFAKQVKIAETQEQKDGTAKFTETESLKFSLNK